MPILSLLQKIKQNETGATAIEFALVLPVLLTFLLGIIASGQAFFALNNAQRAVQMAARQVMINPSYTTADIEAYMADQMTNLPKGNISASLSAGSSADLPISVLQADISYPISLPFLPEMNFEFQVENHIPINPDA